MQCLNRHCYECLRRRVVLCLRHCRRLVVLLHCCMMDACASASFRNVESGMLNTSGLSYKTIRTVYSTIRTGETRELLDGERRILAPTFCLLADRPKWSFRPSKIFALMIAPTRKGLLLFYGATVLSVDTSDIQQKRAAGCFEKTLLLPVCRLCFAF